MKQFIILIIIISITLTGAVFLCIKGNVYSDKKIQEIESYAYESGYKKGYERGLDEAL